MAEIHYLISDASKKVDVEAHVLRYWEEELELSIPRTEMGHRYYTEFHVRLFQQVKQLKEKGYQLKAIKAALIKTMTGGSVVPGAVLEEEVLEALKETGIEELQEAGGEYEKTDMAERKDAVKKEDMEKSEGAVPKTRAERELRAVMKARGVMEARGTEKVRTAIKEATEFDDMVKFRTGTEGAEPESEGTGLAAQEPEKMEGLLTGERMEQFQKVMNHIIGRAMEENSEKLSQDISYLVHDKLMKEMEYLMRVSDEREEERFKRLDESIRIYQRENQGRAEAAASVSVFPFFRLKKKRFGRNGNKL